MATGKIAWFSETKNYGFVSPDDGGADVFMHGTAADGIHHDVELEPGLRVQFEMIDSPKRAGAKCAANVVLLP